MTEVTNTFGSDNVMGPFCGDETVEFMYLESRTTVIYEGFDAIFFYFAAFRVVMFVFVLMVVFVSFSFFFFLFGSLTLYFSNPSC